MLSDTILTSHCYKFLFPQPAENSLGLKAEEMEVFYRWVLSGGRFHLEASATPDLIRFLQEEKDSEKEKKETQKERYETQKGEHGW